MTVKELYNMLESEVDAGRLTLESQVYFEYDDICFGSVDDYKIKQNGIYLYEIIKY